MVTSASLMAVGDASEKAVAFAHAYPSLALGLYLTLVQGRPIFPRAGRSHPRSQLIDTFARRSEGSS
jgi:predicted glycoside hydrolase/deacetylase ChbG (UPF0249 family)